MNYKIDNVIILNDTRFQDIKIHFVHLNESSQMSFEKYESYLDEKERNRASKFANEKLYSRYIILHGKLREIIGENLSVSPEKLKFGQNSFNKPYILNPATNLSFNISKSENKALIAIGRNCSIGVDIEKLRSIHDMSDILKYCLSDKEKKLIKNTSIKSTLTLWTLKESVVKASGEGLLRHFNTIEFSEIFPPKMWGINGIQQNGSWKIASFKPDSKNIAAIAVKRKNKIKMEKK